MEGASGGTRTMCGTPHPRLIMPNGKCTTCSRNAMNSCVTCLFCKDKFHAHDCTIDSPDICNATFFKMFKPLTEKSGVNSTRPGNFKFICDNCLTNFELDQAADQNDKLHKIENKVEGLESSVLEIKRLLLHSPNNIAMCSAPSAAFASISMNKKSETVESLHQHPTQKDENFDSHNMWNDSKRAIGVIKSLQPEIHTSSTFDNGSKIPVQASKQKSILIIGKIDDESVEKDHMKFVRQTMIKEKVSIKNSYKNRIGNTVLVCDSLEHRDKLKDELVKNRPELVVKAPPNLQPVIAVVGFDKECSDNELIDALVNQNHYISDFFSLNKCSFNDHINHLVTKPLKNDPESAQAIFRVSSSLRKLLTNFNDKVTIGSTCCKVYDRRNVKRCNNCFKFGHFAAQCPAEEPTCGFCSESHQTRSCPNKESGVPICCNCSNSDDDSANAVDHPAYSFNCPMYKKQLNQKK